MEKGIALLGLALTTLVFGDLSKGSVAAGFRRKYLLVSDLTRSYMTEVEPDKSTLNIGIAPICFRYDRATGVLTTNAWEKLTWTDKRLSWNPEDYNGIESIRLSSKLIWVPDTKLYNSLSVTEERDFTKVVVLHNGTVIWVPTIVYRTLCTNEAATRQLNCQFKIGSWTYDADTLPLALDPKPVDASEYQNSTCPVAFKSSTAFIRTKHYDCCKEPYSHAEFNIQFENQDNQVSKTGPTRASEKRARLNTDFASLAQYYLP